MIEVGVLSEIFCLTAGLLSSVISPTEWTAPTASSFYCREGIICLSIHAALHNKRTKKKTEKKRHRKLNIKKGNMSFKPGIDIQAVQSNNSWPFSYKIGNAYLCCVILALSLFLSVFYFIRSFLPSAARHACDESQLRQGHLSFSWSLCCFIRTGSTSTLLWYTYWQPESSPNKSDKNVGMLLGLL